MVQEENSSHLQRRSYSSGAIGLFIGGIALVLAAMVLVGVIGLSEWRVRAKTGQLIAENRLLGHQLKRVNTKMVEVRSTLDSLAMEEEAIRVRVDLPPLGEDVRQAGIGSKLPLEDQVIGDERVETLLEALDQIERELAVQQQSFREIQHQVVANEEQLKHIPAIIPLQGGRLTDGFGYRRDPFTRARRMHHGADFAAPRGTPVSATANGTVMQVKRMSGYGKLVEIDHGYGYTTIYAHLNSWRVRRGQKVQRGDIIGTVGNTGRSTGPHLHYEVQVDGEPVDPLDFFYEGYELARGR